LSKTAEACLIKVLIEYILITIHIFLLFYVDRIYFAYKFYILH